MNLQVTGLFRKDAYTHDFTRPPSKNNPGGGLAKKTQQLARALPNIKFTNCITELADITIMETLWLSGFEVPEERKDEDKVFRNMLIERAKAYADYPGYKILWTSDIESLRWDGEIREMIYDASDVIACNSQFMLDMLSVYAPTEKVALLTDPVDTRFIRETHKTKSIYACSHIIMQKGIDDIIHLFGNMVNSDFERIFVGGTTVWGMEINPVSSIRLDKGLDVVCDTRNKAASASQVGEVSSNAFVFLSFADFESFGYAMIEALLDGCWVFCGDHLVYRDRPVRWFSDVEEASVALNEFIADVDLSKTNEEGRQFVVDNYSLPIFRQQFADIVGRCF